ncbi:HBR246Cp [Eremothecium sinecaudum]|uniref:type II protein arginine methyltransferase n=1 Tax=Eremothecium sinecaudum TaxID=45286 RepID=A0A109UXW1_9SACH|nr:HBR246Cp [Eremothecium sinecaudum]AMD19147.1 HBR246Cp [Eremothecium sinecaudum]
MLNFSTISLRRTPFQRTAGPLVVDVSSKLLGRLPTENLRMSFRCSHSYPLMTTQQLLEFKDASLFSSTYRDFMEWNNLKILQRGKFFDANLQKYSLEWENTQKYEPLIAHSLARCMLVDHKLNSFPYFDFNIIIVYTELEKAHRLAKLLLDYVEQVNPEQALLQNCCLVPVYNLPASKKERKLEENTDPRISVIDQGILLAESWDCVLEDPVYVILMDDVMKYLSCDLIRWNKDNVWEQMYVEVETLKDRKTATFREMEYWCNISHKLSTPLDLSYKHGSEMYVPTRFTQLLYHLKNSLPEHKLFALGVSRVQPWYYDWLYSREKRAMENTRAYQVYDIFEKQEVETIFISDFKKLKDLYISINDGKKLVTTDSLSDFNEDWMDLAETEEMLGKDLSREYELLQASRLHILRPV